MKLLDTKEVATNSQQRASIDINTLNNLTDLIDKKRKEIKNLEIDFNFTLEKQQSVWEDEKEKNNREIERLKREIEILEQRRRDNLLPIELRSEDLDKLQAKLEKRKEVLNRKMEEMEETKDKLEEKIEDYNERAREIDKQAQLQTIAQKGIESQRVQIANQAKDLQEMMEKANEEDRRRKNELVRLQSAIDLKEKSLIEKEAKMKLIEEGYVAREKSIQDRYETLQRTLQRFNPTSK